jgi:hypothetical protein
MINEETIVLIEEGMIVMILKIDTASLILNIQMIDIESLIIEMSEKK